MPKALISISPRLAALPALIKRDESGLVQETGERQKWKATLPLLLSNQVIAHCKELTHTSLQGSLCPTRWPGQWPFLATFSTFSLNVELSIIYVHVCCHCINLLFYRR